MDMEGRNCLDTLTIFGGRVWTAMYCIGEMAQARAAVDSDGCGAVGAMTPKVRG